MNRHLPLPTLDQPEQADQAAASSSPPPDAEHLDAIEVDHLEAVQPDPGAAAADGLPVGADGLLSVEAFTTGLRHALTLGGHVTGLQTLLRSPDEATFPDGATAMYESIRAVPALHFLIRPGGLWLQRAAAIAVWAVPVAAGCRAELRDRARQAVPARDPAESAA